MSRWNSPSILQSLPAIVAIAWGTGCGQGGPAVSTSTTEAKVHGKVTVRGKPVKKGMVWFDPANYRRKDVTARSTDVAADGSYSITTLIGENSVRYEGPATAGNRELDGAIQSLDVKEGDNEFDIVLPLQ
jgi:hypothetical protein